MLSCKAGNPQHLVGLHWVLSDVEQEDCIVLLHKLYNQLSNIASFVAILELLEAFTENFGFSCILVTPLALSCSRLIEDVSWINDIVRHVLIHWGFTLVETSWLNE